MANKYHCILISLYPYILVSCVTHEDEGLCFIPSCLSLSCFILQLYLAYPAILTGCVTILVGFWYRKGAPISHRRRASLLVLLPLVVLNGFGLGMTFAWAQIVSMHEKRRGREVTVLD